MRPTTQADTNLILAAVSGRSFGTKLYKIKGQPWPFYYGIQPSGRYPDQPFVKELYYNGANPIILHRVPQPNVPARYACEHAARGEHAAGDATPTPPRR